MLLVADTSALVALAVSDSLTLLDRLFESIRVPPAVFRECVASGKPAAVSLLGIMLRAKDARLVAKIAPLIDAAREAGLRHSDELVREALRLAGEL